MKTNTLIILAIVAVGTYMLYKRSNKKATESKDEVKAGFVSAQDKVGTLAKNGL